MKQKTFFASPAVKTGIAMLMCGLGLCFLSCATTNPYRYIDEAVERQDFARGVALIESGQEGKKPLYTEDNAVSLFLDKGLLEYYAGNYKDSAQSLLRAERLIEEAYTKSVTAEIGSYIANDNTKEYPGEDFEDIYINVFNALSFYSQGNAEAALVEIRKLYMPGGKLDMLSRKYEGKGRSAGEYALEQLSKIGFSVSPDLPQGSSAHFTNSALARYLAALFLLGEGNPDARPDLEFAQVAAAFADNPNVYRHPIPGAVAAAQSVPGGKARLNVVAFAGLSPVKEEAEFAQFFPFFQNAALEQPVFKLPRFVDRPDGINRIEVTAGGERFELELLEDMGEVMKETYNARFGNLFFKTYIRVLLKYAAADVAATAAGKSKGGALAASASAIAGKAAADASEGADIRMSRYLPGRAYIGGVNLDPGVYTATVSYYSGGRLVARTEHVNVAVRANALNLVNSASLGSEGGPPPGGTHTVATAPAGAESGRDQPPGGAGAAGTAPMPATGGAAENGSSLHIDSASGQPKVADSGRGRAARLNTLGGSAGTSFADPALILTVRGTFSPSRNWFIEPGLDLGLVSVYEGVEKYFSVYPYAHTGLFLPFGGKGGWYAGAGIGGMLGKYTFAGGGTSPVGVFAADFITGFNIGNFFDISYTLRTDFGSANSKLSMGFVKRFE